VSELLPVTDGVCEVVVNWLRVLVALAVIVWLWVPVTLPDCDTLSACVLVLVWD
jgi:hypothetical protein